MYAQNENNTQLIWISIPQVVFFMLYCLSCPLWGQAGIKEDLTPRDFSKWHHLYDPKISDNGKWASFLLSYENRVDTLVLQNITSKEKIYIPRGSDPQFINNANWVFYRQNDSLQLFNLESRSTKTFINALDYRVSKDLKYLSIFSAEKIKDTIIENTLEIMDFDLQSLITLKGVLDFSFNKDENLLAYTLKMGSNTILGVVALENATIKNTTIRSFDGTIQKLVWGPNKELAVIENTHDNSNQVVHWFRHIFDKASLETCNLEEAGCKYCDYSIVNNRASTLHFSLDGEMLFFHIQKKPTSVIKENHGSEVQIWNAKDRFIFPATDGNEFDFKIYH